jgi:dihydrofolate reductase
MAISIDGLITKGKTDSDWVSKNDWDQFDSYLSNSDAVIMGRKTMEQFDNNDFPIEGLTNFVLSGNKKLHKKTKELICLKASPKEAVSMMNKMGHRNALLIGGEYTNNQFLRAGLIDEIVLSIHPLIIGEGLTLFGRKKFNIDLDLIEARVIKRELVQIRYRVNN